MIYALFVISLVVALISKNKTSLYFCSYVLGAGVVLSLVADVFISDELFFTSVVGVILYMAVYARCYINRIREYDFNRIIIMNTVIFSVCVALGFISDYPVSLVLLPAMLFLFGWKELKKADSFILLPLFMAGGIFYGVFRRLMQFATAIVYSDSLIVFDVNEFTVTYKNGINDGAVLCAMLLSVLFVIWYRKKQSYVTKLEFNAVIVGLEVVFGGILYVLFYKTPTATQRTPMIAQLGGYFVMFVVIAIVFAVVFAKYLDRRKYGI